MTSSSASDAGYDVASCLGPFADERTVCPLVTEGRCAAVEVAHVVISTPAVGVEVIAAPRRHYSGGLIVQATDADATRIRQTQLVASVEARGVRKVCHRPLRRVMRPLCIR